MAWKPEHEMRQMQEVQVAWHAGWYHAQQAAAMQMQHQQLQPHPHNGAAAVGGSWHYGMPTKAREAEAEAKAKVLREMLMAKQAVASRSPGESSSQGQASKPPAQWEVVDRELDFPQEGEADTEEAEQDTKEEKTEDGCPNKQVAGLKPKASSRAQTPGKWIVDRSRSPLRRRPAEAEGSKGDNRSAKREEGKAVAGDMKSYPGPVPPWRRKPKARLRSPSGPPPPRPPSKKEKKKEKAAKDKDELARALLDAAQSLLRRP